ncbi:MAG TPA: 2-oxo acid dehydrogenase subunit E2 [Ignavibacteria bacterium]
MIKEIKLPEVSESIQVGTIVKVLVNTGDMLEEDQPMIELETEKAMFEVPSTEKGKIVEILVKEGDKIEVGSVILKIDDGTGEAKSETVKTEKPKEDIKKKKNIESVPEKVKPSAMQETEIKPVENISKPEEKIQNDTTLVNASPVVRKFARELGVELKDVPETDNDGRITEKEVKNYVKSVFETGGLRQANVPLPDFSRWGEVRKEPMSKVRAITAKSMSHSLSIPQVTQYDKADITELEEFRKKQSAKNKSDVKVTVTSILLRIISSALRQFPQFNASIDMKNQEIIYKDYYNIGVAVDTERGLLVPVVKDVDKKNVIELSLELTVLSEKARNKKIMPDEMEGGNFTISNLGGIGGTGFSPIVYSPQVAILGVSRASTEAVWIDDKFEPRLLLPLSLSYDHRLIDGADATRFLRWVCNALENPFLI